MEKLNALELQRVPQLRPGCQVPPVCRRARRNENVPGKYSMGRWPMARGRDAARGRERAETRGRRTAGRTAGTHGTDAARGPWPMRMPVAGTWRTSPRGRAACVPSCVGVPRFQARSTHTRDTRDCDCESDGESRDSTRGRQTGPTTHDHRAPAPTRSRRDETRRSECQTTESCVHEIIRNFCTLAYTVRSSGHTPTARPPRSP